MISCQNIWSIANQRRSDIREFDKTVTVLVGKDEKRFILHQDAVCAKSKFFQAMCSKPCLEGHEQIARLPETTVATFQAYCSWIYTGYLQERTCTEESEMSDKNDEQEALVELYLLGNTLDDIKLRDSAKSMLFYTIKCHETLPCESTVEMIWNSTPSGSLLRKMIVDAFVATADRDMFAEAIHKFPADFAREVAAAALKAASTSSWDCLADKLWQYTEKEQSE